MDKLTGFLQKYNTIIFDMDGVVTSEQNYWNSAALTIYEYLNSKQYLGISKIDTNYMMENIQQIRRHLFCDDILIEVLKNKGVNSNWDLAYIVIALSVILHTSDARDIIAYENQSAEPILTQYQTIAKGLADTLHLPVSECVRNGRMWMDIHHCFQEWFLGDELYEKTYGRRPNKEGKSGLVHHEQPLVPLPRLREIFFRLSDSGKRICIGTGRPYTEIFYPLKAWDVLPYFAEDGFITYTQVAEAEEKFPNLILTKPNPFMFLKALYGTYYPEIKLLRGEYDKTRIAETLVVGDAGADILAAKAMGADFCAVLTGISGEKMRTFFEQEKAEYICRSIEDFLE